MVYSRLESLTALRFFLSMFVILFHLYENIKSRIGIKSHIVDNLFMQGHFAVSVFFVLSGFVLAWSYHEKIRRGYILEFYRARVARVYPVYLTGIIFVAIAYCVGSPYSYNISEIPRAQEDFALNVVLIQSWIRGRAFGWNPVNWTLSVEAFFYITFPAIVIMLRDCSVGKLIFCLGISVSAGFVLDILHRHIGLREEIGAKIYLFSHVFPLARMGEFVSGVVACLLFTKISIRISPAFFCSAALLLSLQVLFLMTTPIFEFAGQRALVPTFVLIIVLFALGDRAGARTPRILIYLGEISFAAYIVHVPILQVFLYYAPDMQTFLFSAIYIAIVLILSALIYRLVEAPLRRILLGYARTVSPTPLVSQASDKT